MKVAFLTAGFYITALLYASVGFGGGSTYTALLVLFGANYLIIPIVSLCCNILVVTGNSWRYARAGLITTARAWPFLILSVPLAWIGGRIPINETYFIGLLSLSLLFAGMSMLVKQTTPSNSPYKTNSASFNALIGGGLGLLSGMVGIGGGIFLAPILHRVHWGKPKEIAALCSLFILVNSISGLLGQLMKTNGSQLIELTQPYWILAPLVLVGGTIGNRLSLKVFSENTVRIMTALLVLFVALRLLWKFSNIVLS